MLQRPSFPGLAGAAVAAVALVASAAAYAQAKPAAPTSVCIQDTTGPSNCANVVSTPTGTGIKWNPGHYIRPSAQSFASKRAERHDWYSKIRNNPNFKGGLITATWGTIEPRQGVYDFSEIDADLAYLKSIGKKFIIEVWWMNYWHNIANARGQGWVPDYMIDNGCAIGSTYESGGYTIQFHKAECMDRLIALFQALGKRYDADPDVEQIIVTEPSTPYPTWNADQYLVQFKRLMPLLAASWPRTNRVFYMNWFAQPGEMIAAMAANGVGVGGPDILPGPPIFGWEDDGSRALRGAGGNFGAIDYRGKIPVNYSYQAAGDMGPATLMDYSLNTLKATHLAWSPAGHMPTHMNWDTGVVPAVQAVSGRVGSTACPTVYGTACNK